MCGKRFGNSAPGRQGKQGRRAHSDSQMWVATFCRHVVFQSQKMVDVVSLWKSGGAVCVGGSWCVLRACGRFRGHVAGTVVVGAFSNVLELFKCTASFFLNRQAATMSAATCANTNKNSIPELYYNTLVFTFNFSKLLIAHVSTKS